MAGLRREEMLKCIFCASADPAIRDAAAPAKLTLPALVERVKLQKIGLSTKRQSHLEISEIGFPRLPMLGWDIAEGYYVCG